MPKNRDVTVEPTESEAAARITGSQRLALWILGLLVRVWGRTIRLRIDPADRAALARRDVPVALVLWHNRLFMAPEIIRRLRDGKPFHGLVSASKDGAWLAGFFAMIGIKSVRGSTSWQARESVKAMIKVAQAGGDIGITPDGPRGPRYEFKRGSLIIARRAKMPLLLVGIEFNWVKQLRSWDRFIIPLPFSCARIRCRQVQPADLPKDRTEAITALTAVMADLNGRRR